VPLAAVAVNPAGNVSVTVTVPAVGPVPTLLAVRVNVTVPPGAKLVPVCVFVMVISGTTSEIESVAVSFVKSFSPPPETIAVFIKVPVAVDAMDAVTVIGGRLPPGPAEANVEQASGDSVHVQPVPPLMAVAVSPAGNWSETKDWPTLAVGPMLLTLRVNTTEPPGMNTVPECDFEIVRSGMPAGTGTV